MEDLSTSVVLSLPRLKTIIADQESELALYLEDHHHYLRELEQLQEPYRYLHEERKITI